MSDIPSNGEAATMPETISASERMSDDAAVASRRWWRWLVAFVLLAAVVTGFFDRISIAVLFTDKAFNSALGTNFQPLALGLLMTAFLFAYAISSLLLSFVGDLFGARRTLGYAAGAWGVLMILMGGSRSYMAMIAYRIALGIAEGPQFSLISGAIRQWFPTREQARANSIWMIGSPLGSAIGFPLTIWLVATFGWRSSFYVLGFLTLIVVMPLIFIVMRRPPQAAAPDEQASPVSGEGANPVETVRDLIKTPRVWMLCGYGTGMLTFLWGLNGWLPTYLQRVRHFNIHQMGFYSSLPFVLMFIAEVASGYIADKTDRRARNSLFGLCSAGILLFLATLVSDGHLSAILIALSTAALGFGSPTHYALAMRVLPPALTSTGIGIINGVGNLLAALAPTLIGWIIASTGNFQIGLLVIVFASIFGGLSLIPLVRAKL
jgi:sugar phosphate permease